MIQEIQNWYLRRKFNLPNSVIMPEIKEEDAQYGAIFGLGEPKLPSFDWRPYQPTPETQVLTYDCTAFGTLNCWEHMAKKADYKTDEGAELNLSDLYAAVLGGVGQGGGDPKQVADMAHSKGIVEQKYCFYDQDMLMNPNGTWAKRLQKFNAVPASARRYLGPNYSYVNSANKNEMAAALEHSPLGIVVALDEHWRDQGVVKYGRALALHWITLQHIDKDGYYHVFDSDSKSNKILEPGYPIRFALSYRELPKDWKAKNKSVLILKDSNSAAVGVLKIPRNSDELITLAAEAGLKIDRPIDWATVINGNYSLK